jgi:hypothetical protein
MQGGLLLCIVLLLRLLVGRLLLQRPELGR